MNGFLTTIAWFAVLIGIATMLEGHFVQGFWTVAFGLIAWCIVIARTEFNENSDQ